MSGIGDRVGLPSADLSQFGSVAVKSQLFLKSSSTLLLRLGGLCGKFSFEF